MTTPSDTNHPHSIYGASGAKTWRNCAGSVRVIQEAKENGDIPENTETQFSKEGAIAHDWATKVLTNEIPLGEMPDEFREHLEGYIYHCRGVEQQAGLTYEGPRQEHVVLNERMVPLFYRPQDLGTVDHAVICPEFIHVTDLKYGVGVNVDAEDNDQAQIYAISLIQELEIMEGYSFNDDMPVHITIYQPRHFSFTGEPETWEVTVGFLREAAGLIEQDYKNAQRLNVNPQCSPANSEDNPDLNPSDAACQFCDAKGVCRVRAKTSFGGLPAELDIEADFDIETGTKADLPKAKDYNRETLTPEQIAWICKNGSTIKNIIDNVIDAETKRIQQGGEIRLVKLIPGSLGNRTWVDEKEAETFVRGLFGAAESYKPRKLLTAPQVLAKAKEQMGEMSTIAKLKLGLTDKKTAEKSKTKCLIHRPEGKPKLVPIDHEAEALVFTSPADDFEDEIDGSDLL